MHFSLALSGLLRLLENLLDNLLLLNQESTDNAVLDTSGAAGTTVGTADVLLGAGDLGVFTGTKGGNTRELDATVTALGSSALLLDVEVPELAAGGLDNADLVGPRVVRVPSPVLQSVVRHFVCSRTSAALVKKLAAA